MQWSNYFLIPIVLIGGLLAFWMGRTIVARVLWGIASLFGTVSTKVAATVPQATAASPAPITFEPPTLSQLDSSRKPLAARKEALAVQLLCADDKRIDLDQQLRAQDEEEARRAQLIDDARKRYRSNNVLVGKLDVPAAAGPMTQAIKMTEDTLATLKAARDSQK